MSVTVNKQIHDQQLLQKKNDGNEKKRKQKTIPKDY